MSERNYWTNLRRRKISRRTMLGASAKAGVGAAGLALVGCGGDDDDDAPAAAEAQAEEQAAQAEPEAQAEEEQAEEEQAVAQTGPRRGGRIFSPAVGPNVGGFDTHISVPGLDHSVYLEFIYDNLLNYDGGGRIVPGLAESIEIPDDVTYIFNLRPGVIFQDGEPVNAEAVRLNYERLIETVDEAGGNLNRAHIINSVSREAVGNSWKMVNDKPFGPTLVEFYSSSRGAPISPNHFDTAITNPVGAGMAKFDEYRDGEVFKVSSWDGYWDSDRVFVDGMTREVISDQQSHWVSFLAGETTWAVRTDGVTEDLVAELEADGRPVIISPFAIWMNTWYNLHPSNDEWNVFRDPRLRAATNLGMDREGINDVATGGLGEVSQGPMVSNASWALTKDYYADSPDIPEAKKLMDAAGYGDGLSATFIGFGRAERTSVTDPLLEQMRQNLDIDFEVVYGTEAVTLERMFTAKDWSMASLSWDGPFDPHIPIAGSVGWFRDWMYGAPDGPGTGDAINNSSDAVAVALNHTQELVDAAASTASQEDRLPLYAELFQDYKDNGWQHNIIHYGIMWTAQPNVKGLEIRRVDGRPTGLGYKDIWFDDV